MFGAGGTAAFRVLRIASRRIIPAAWLAVLRFAAGLTVPGSTAGLSIVGRGGLCVFAVAAIHDCFSVLAVSVAASHACDIFSVAAGLRLVIRGGLIAMEFCMIAAGASGICGGVLFGRGRCRRRL